MTEITVLCDFLTGWSRWEVLLEAPIRLAPLCSASDQKRARPPRIPRLIPLNYWHCKFELGPMWAACDVTALAQPRTSNPLAS